MAGQNKAGSRGKRMNKKKAGAGQGHEWGKESKKRQTMDKIFTYKP